MDNPENRITRTGHGTDTSRGAVLVALSGGVDSCVCVHLLREQGYQVRAVVMRMSELHQAVVDAAEAAAASLEIPLTVLDLRQAFREQVIGYFLEEYSHGRTPNPCVFCNPWIKFRALVEEADRQGCRWIATGHYARVRQAGEEYQLWQAASLERDQTYMLYRLGQRELSRLLLPLAELEKPQVRTLAASLGLAAADLPDSQENCFISGKDYAAYIEEQLGTFPAGAFISPEGQVCGEHQGIIRYTVGQRKGLGIALGRPVFVRRIDPAENRIYLGEDDREPEARIAQVTTLSGRGLEEGAVQVKIRSAAPPVPAWLVPESDGALVRFALPQRAVAPGQSLVIYQNGQLLGGGVIQ
ncbi:MAG: tRNA 2-thiouridine(34) synthase MnmA [Oscillospiraceae bacterium]|jgi:tRNA-specific 2-thiouridylase|nr:tRNA 2-thiouridine(34) synthase MnmA [Oscillospiraceae bacterium]